MATTTAHFSRTLVPLPAMPPRGRRASGHHRASASPSASRRRSTSASARSPGPRHVMTEHARRVTVESDASSNDAATPKKVPSIGAPPMPLSVRLQFASLVGLAFVFFTAAYLFSQANVDHAWDRTVATLRPVLTDGRLGRRPLLDEVMSLVHFTVVETPGSARVLFAAFVIGATAGAAFMPMSVA